MQAMSVIRAVPAAPRRDRPGRAARPARSAAGRGGAERRRLVPVRSDSAVHDRHNDRHAGPTAPEAVVRSHLYLCRLLGKTLAGPRLVRRTLSVRFSGGFSRPGESITGHPSGPYDVSVLRGVHVQHHASTAAVSTTLARSAGPHGALVRAACHCQFRLPET